MNTVKTAFSLKEILSNFTNLGYIFDDKDYNNLMEMLNYNHTRITYIHCAKRVGLNSDLADYFTKLINNNSSNVLTIHYHNGLGGSTEILQKVIVDHVVYKQLMVDLHNRLEDFNADKTVNKINIFGQDFYVDEISTIEVSGFTTTPLFY